MESIFKNVFSPQQKKAKVNKYIKTRKLVSLEERVQFFWELNNFKSVERLNFYAFSYWGTAPYPSS
ncbi:hypothetical protein COK06_11675 [Bacillus cereus]|nr:hypothetical protein CN428_27870 [Bacillus cereus]PFP98011.1 hypothetical protein COK06_11675 [Bacillus cereus]